MTIKLEKNQCDRKYICGCQQERLVMHGNALYYYFIIGDTRRLSVSYNVVI